MVCLQRLEKRNDLLFPDRTIVQPKGDAEPMQSGNDRHMILVEMELHHRTLAFYRPGAHPRRALRQARFVDKDNQPILPAGFFLSAGQMRFFHRSIASSSRSNARRSGLAVEPHLPKQAPNMHVAVSHLEGALDEHPHTLDRP